MKFIHIADVHLGAAPDLGRPWSKARAREIWESFEEVISVCNRDQIDLLLIAGDLFHRQPLKRELKEADYQFSTLTHTKVVIIAGNHDYIREGSVYDRFPWCGQVTFLKSRSMQSVYFPELRTAVQGFSYGSQEIGEPLLDQAKPEKREGQEYGILLAHGGDEKHVPFRQRALAAAGFDYVALGHIHKPQIWQEDGIAYAGSLEPIDKNDLGSRGYIRGELSAEKRKIQFIAAARREYLRVRLTLTPSSTEGALCKKVQEVVGMYGKQNLYRLQLDGEYDPEAPLSLERLPSLGNIVEVTDDTVPHYDLEALAREHQNDIIGMYLQAFGNPEELTEVQKKALYYGITALLGREGR